MDDLETKHRRMRLAELVNSCFAGEQVRLLQHIRARTGKEPNQGEISGLMKLDNPSRSFGDKKAKTLTEQIGLHRRWFDFPLGSNLPVDRWMDESTDRDADHAHDKSDTPVATHIQPATNTSTVERVLIALTPSEHALLNAARPLQEADKELLTQIAQRIARGDIADKTRRLIESGGQDAGLEGLLSTQDMKQKNKSTT